MSGGPAIVARGRWARIHRVELGPSERAPGIPADTAAVPFESWINGWLVEANPGYHHSFGSPPPALRRAGERAFELLFGRDST